MAQKKYVALQDWGTFKTGDPVSVAEAGDDADRLVTEGVLGLSDDPSGPSDAEVAQARETLAAQQDAQQRAGAPRPNVMPTPGNMTALATSLDPALATAPPAVQAQAVAEQTARTDQRDLVRRLERVVPMSVGHTLGPATETTVALSAENGQLVCPNCNRRWDDRPALRGSTIPCLCGTQIEVLA